MEISNLDDGTLPLNFDESANPGHLLQLERSPFDFTDSNDTQTSPLRTRTMKEYDQLIAELKKENFSLKLRIYFLEERIQQKFGRNGGSGSNEDVHKANIELKIELEGLKKDLSDKHSLLLTASNALETLESQHKSEVDKLRLERENERQQLQQKIEQLEKLLEASNEGIAAKCSQNLGMPWSRAFSFMENVSDSDGVEVSSALSNLQKKLSEYEIVISDLNSELSKSHSKVEELESQISSRDELLDKQKNRSAMLKKTIKGFVSIVRDKDRELEVMKEDLIKRMEESKRINEELKQTLDAEMTEKDNRIVELNDNIASLQLQVEQRCNECGKMNDSIEKLQIALTSAERKSDNNQEIINVRVDCMPSKSYCDNGANSVGEEKRFEELLADRNSSFVLEFKEDTVQTLKTLLEQKEIILTELESVIKQKEAEIANFKKSEAMKGFTSISEQLKESNSEVNRLKFVLMSTEGTVHMLGQKVKHYRQLLSRNSGGGDYSEENGRGRRHSIVCLADEVGGQVSVAREVRRSLGSRNVGSSSAPATPMKPDATIASVFPDVGRSEAKALQEEVCRLRLTLASKDYQLGRLQKDFERTRPRCACNDVASQTLPDNGASWKELKRSHNTCELLKGRLEELSEFLERLLQFDENGSLDVSRLTPQKLASIRNQLERSRELSATLSQSLIACDVSSSFARNDSVAWRCRLDDDDMCSARDDESTVIVSSREEDESRNSSRSRRLCDRSLAFGQNSISVASDDFFLLLRPAGNKDVADDVSSAFHESLLASTRLRSSRPSDRHFEAASESDSWSEPDRCVSQQRIGLDGSQLTPPGKGHTIESRLMSTTTTSTESEVLSEFGKCFSQKAMHRWRADLQEMRGLKAHVYELEELNTSLKAELSLYQHVYSNNDEEDTAVATVAARRSSGGGSSKSTSPRAHGGRRARSRIVRDQGQATTLEEQLREISALRKQLEASIKTYDQLREQMENKLTLMRNENAASVEYELAIGQLFAQVESCKAQIEERDSALRNLHKEKGNLLLEIQQLSEDQRVVQEHVETLKGTLAEREKESSRAMTEMRSLVEEHQWALEDAAGQRVKLDAALTEAHQLLTSREESLRRLQQSNDVLQENMERATKQAERATVELTSKEDALKRAQDDCMRLESSHQKLSGETETVRQQILCAKEDKERVNGQLQAALALNHSLKTELRLYERMATQSHHKETSIEVRPLMSELRSLRLQLERSIEVNVALRSQLESYEAARSPPRPQLLVRTDDDDDAVATGASSSMVGSPEDMASSFSFNPTDEQRRPSKGVNKSWDGDEEEATKPLSPYSSPDLGIESDPSRFSSLDRRAASDPYLEPGCPGRDDWTSTASAPSSSVAVAVARRRYVPQKHNVTYPFEGGRSPADRSETCAVVSAEDFSLLRQEVARALELLAAIVVEVQVLPSEDNGLRKSLMDGCDALKRCLRDSCAALSRFCVVPLPLSASSEDDSCLGSLDSKEENRRLEGKLLKLRLELVRERHRAEDALKKLQVANRIKENMEKAIVKQLNKTHCVLKKARGNLEQKQQQCGRCEVPK